METCKSFASTYHPSHPINLPSNSHLVPNGDATTNISKSQDSNGLLSHHSSPITIESPKRSYYFDTCSPPEESSPYSTGSVGRSWFTEAIAELHIENLSPRSDAFTDESRSRSSSIDQDRKLSLTEVDSRSRTTSRCSLDEEEDPEYARDLLAVNEAYFLSQDNIDYCEDSKNVKNKGLRNKLLNVLQTERARHRSASQGEVLYKPPEFSTSPVAQRMRHFFTRMRSQSQGDIVIPSSHKFKTAINEEESEDNESLSSSNNALSRQSTESVDMTPSAINKSLLKKLKSSIKKSPARKKFYSGSRRSSVDILSSIGSIYEEPRIEEAKSEGNLFPEHKVPRRYSVDTPYATDRLRMSASGKASKMKINESTYDSSNIPVILVDDVDNVDHVVPCSRRSSSDIDDDYPKDFEIVNMESVTHFDHINSNQNDLLRPPLRRLRSKSDPSIVVDDKLKRKDKWEPKIVVKLKQKHRQWKKHRGSLPDVLWGNHHGSSENVSRNSSRRNSGTKTPKSKKGLLGAPIASNLLNITSSIVFYDLIQQSKSTEHLDFPDEEDINPYRGKSRSVDHTLQRPFDLDLLRRKIGERTSSEPSRDMPPSWTDPTELRGDNATPPEKKGGAPRTMLSGPTIAYTVQANDTLMSIAARFETTPSELTKLNRLSTRFLFPGQLLLVPDKGGAKENLCGENGTFKDCRGNNFLTDLVPPFSLQSGNCPATPANSVEHERSIDRECLEKFLKIQVRHITDGQGVVAGVLLVTPNAVMFDPNVSDPLVIERGPESYGVIAPMDLVVNAALYYDIAHMKVKDTGLTRPDLPKPEIFWGPPESRPNSSEDRLDGLTSSSELLRAGDNGALGDMGGSEESPSKDCPYPELTPQDNDNDSSCSCGGDTRETSAFPKAFEHEILTPISSDVSPTGGEQPPLSESRTVLQGHPLTPSPSPSPLVLQVDIPEEEVTSSTLKEDLTPAYSPQISHPVSPLLPPPTSPQIQVAQSQQCDTKASFSSSSSSSFSSQDIPAQPQPQVKKMPLHVSSSVPLTNDKKRTTSVTFSTSSESDMPPLPEDGGELPLHESRKQKVLKRISYPLSWMESFGADKDGHMVNQHPSVPSSAPPSGNWGTPGGYPVAGVDPLEGGRPGMFGNVFSISNVSNMLTRRPSLDNFKRPAAPAPSSGESLLSTSLHSNLGHQDIDPNNPQAQKRAQFKEGPKYGLKSMVSMDDMPELFASFDKLIPKPASSSEESPLYLCLRMGIPLNKPIPRTTPIMTYGKKTMKPEYWFSIPKTRTNELFNFFQIWATQLYGELDEEAVKARGFDLIEEEIEIWPGHLAADGGDAGFGAADELKEMTKESWEKIKAPYAKLYSIVKSGMTISLEAENQEVVSMSEDLRKALYSSASLTSLDIEVFLPEVQGTSEVIDDCFRKNMFKKLPARVQGYNWRLAFSTAENGFSLKTLYRKMSYIDSPIILFIQDTQQNKFGALLSCPLRVSELFYGTGESFMFVCQPEFQIFPWTGENTFFVKGNNESLYVGGGDGKFGIWLDGDLYQGRTQPCKTYGNPVLSSSEDFIIKTVECWYFE